MNIIFAIYFYNIIFGLIEYIGSIPLLVIRILAIMIIPIINQGYGYIKSPLKLNRKSIHPTIY
jgi:hypothetical protein